MGKQIKRTYKEKEQIVKELLGGASYQYVASKYNVSRAGTIANWKKKYLEGKTFSDGVVLQIQSLLGNNVTGGYYFNSITPKTSNVLNEEGYPFGTLPVLYGEYSDGAYREYINLYAIDRRIRI